MERGLVVELVLGAKKERTSKRILNNLFLIAKKGTTPRRFSTSCFLLQRKEQPQNESPQVAFDCKERGNLKKILNKLFFIALLRYLCLREMQAARQCGLVDNFRQLAWKEESETIPDICYFFYTGKIFGK